MSSYSDILTPADLQADALNALSIDVTDDAPVSGLGASYREVATRAISDVTHSIEQHLDRKLMVRLHEQETEDYKWGYNRARSVWQYYPDQYPVVQVLTAGAEASQSGTCLLSSSQTSVIEYYGGYRREEQDLQALQSELEDLTTLPDVLPGDIRRVGFRLVMYELQMAMQNTFATGSVTKQSGQATAEITRTREDVYQKELRKISTHRRML